MLRPWAIETRHQRGRTLFGVTGAGEDQVDDVARALATIADSGDVISEPLVDGISWTFEMPLLLRHMADDLRTFITKQSRHGRAKVHLITMLSINGYLAKQFSEKRCC